jgi:hypothetical protein
MADILKTFNDIKALLINVKTSKIDDTLDNSIKDILSYRSNSGRVGYVDYLQTLISKSASNMESFKNLNELNFGGTGLMGREHGKRISRYQAYESITHYINYCLRALQVLVDNILSPDDIDKISLNVIEKDISTNEAESNAKLKEVKQLIKSLNIEKNIEMIVKTTLHHGDYFAEITDTKHVFTSKTVLTESENVIDDETIITEAFEYTDDSKKIKDGKFRIILDFQSIDDISIDNKKNDKEHKTMASQNDNLTSFMIYYFDILTSHCFMFFVILFIIIYRYIINRLKI